MSNKRVSVMIMGRNLLDDDEFEVLKATYPEGTKFSFVRTDPKDPKEHVKLCQELNPDVVFVPKVEPVPVLAMKQGFSHVVLVGGALGQLATPQFHKFEP